jgi:hypothetical protein
MSVDALRSADVDDFDPAARPKIAAPEAGQVRSTRSWAGAAAAAGVTIAVLRWWVTRDRREYSLWPDEPAQLAIARFVGGGTHWTMRNHSIWRPGYGTLLGPVYAFTDDPQLVFRAAMVLNGVLGGVAAALLVLLARRLTGFGPLGAAACAVAVAATPALLFPTGFVWSESLIAPLYLGAVLGLVRFWDAPSVGRGVVVAVLCGAGFATHSRLLPLALVTVLLVAMAVERGLLTRRHAVLVVAALAASLLAAARYSAFVTDRLWDEPSTRNSISGVLQQFANPAAIGLSAIGQAWYLLAGSLGVLAVAAVELLRRGMERGVYGVVALVTAAQVALSVVFMADRWRPDQLVYGRYNDVVVAPLLVIGLACLAGRGRTVWTRGQLVFTIGAAGGITLVAAVVLWGLRSDVLHESNGLEPMILAIQPFVAGRPTIPLVRITLLALAASVVLIAGATLRRGVGAVAVVVPLLVVATIRTDHVLDRGWSGSGGLEEVGELDDPGAPLHGGLPVDYYLPQASNSTGRLMLYQWYLPDSDFTVVGQPLTQVSSIYVFAESNNATLIGAGAQRVWTDPLKPVSLWQRG